MIDSFGDFNHKGHYPSGKLVTVYGVTQYYGGTEEGGWWYDWLTPLVSFRANGLRRFKRAIDKAVAFVDAGDEVDRFDRLEILQEGRRGEWKTLVRPYYS